MFQCRPQAKLKALQEGACTLGVACDHIKAF